MSSDLNKTVKEARAKAEETAEAFGFDSQTKSTKPVGHDSEASKLSRYAERPEGLDQFGGEESERERIPNAGLKADSAAPEGLKKYTGNPSGIDTFGGEETERTL